MTSTGRKGFLAAGHFPTLVAALLYFDVSFMVWVLLGPLAPFVGDEFHLSATEQGLMVSVPLLGGAFFRPILGTLGDRFGGRRIGLGALLLTIVPLVVGWKLASSPAHLYALGLLLGIAGASFAVALPLASRWYPPEYQGLAMGIAGAGNSGSLLATLCAPRLAERFGWQTTFAFMILPVLLVLAAFAIMAKDSPQRRPRLTLHDYFSILKEPDALWFSFLYGLTFGGFVGFTSFLTTFFHDQYGLARVDAGDFTTIVVVSGSLLRPVGGWLSDRVGGYRLLLLVLAGVMTCLAGAASLPRLPIMVAILFTAVGLLGMGNGAVFQLVPQRFADRMGVVTGLVGAAGGLGGFFLPSVLGSLKDATGTYGIGLLACSAVFLAGVVVLLELGARWRFDWAPAAVEQSGIFCYRDRMRAILGERAA